MVKIAHISDVHWERLDADASRRLTNALTREKPNAIAFTGDLVDNPWNLRQAKLWLLELCDACGLNRYTDLIVVPGNHDYRLFGNVGFKPLTGLLFRHCFRSWLGRRVVFSRDLNVTFLRIDSNPVAFGFARGWVGRWELRRLARELAKEAPEVDRSLKIALLHHHPLPIPYEGGDTFLMLKDAQRLIQFLAEHRVEMVLHGHKHRAPDSLLSLGTCVTGDRVIAVLGAGTAVAGGTDREARGRNFNLICIEETGLHYVRQFFAQPGDDFVEKSPTRSPVQSFERAYERALAVGHKYQRIHWDMDIDVEGDRFNELTYTGVTPVGGKELVGIQLPEYTVETGHLSDVWLNPNKTSPGCSIQVLAREPRRIGFRVDFPKPATDAAPARFSIQSFDFNAISMDLSEFQKRFPRRRQQREYEEKAINEPTEEFSWTIRFPRDLRFRYPPEFEVCDASGKARHEWLTRLLQPSFYFSEALHTAFLSIHKPPVNYRYRIYWYIPPGASAAAVPNLQHKCIVEQFGTTLLALHREVLCGRDLPRQLEEVIRVLETFGHLVARRIEERTPPHLVEVGALEVSLMTYDDSQSEDPPKLRVVAYTGSHKEYWDFALEVGDGNAGRAYKKNFIRSFDATVPLQDPKMQCYVVRPGYPSHLMLYSMPLRHPQSQELIFAILNVGSASRQEAGLLRSLANEEGMRWLQEQAQCYVLTRLLELSNMKTE